MLSFDKPLRAILLPLGPNGCGMLLRIGAFTTGKLDETELFDVAKHKYKIVFPTEANAPGLREISHHVSSTCGRPGLTETLKSALRDYNEQ